MKNIEQTIKKMKTGKSSYEQDKFVIVTSRLLKHSI